MQLNYISQNSLSYVFPATRSPREILLRDLEDVNERATILQFTTHPGGSMQQLAAAPTFLGLPPASLTPGGKCVSQTSQGSILVLASAGPPHRQLDATRTRHETHPREFSRCLWFQLILVSPHSAPIIPPRLYLVCGLKVPPQMWRTKPHRDCLGTPAPTIK